MKREAIEGFYVGSELVRCVFRVARRLLCGKGRALAWGQPVRRPLKLWEVMAAPPRVGPELELTGPGRVVQGEATGREVSG